MSILAAAVFFVHPQLLTWCHKTAQLLHTAATINISIPHFIQSLAIFILIKKSHERNKSSFVFGMIPDRISVQAIFISFIVCLCLPPTLGSTKPVFLGN